MNDMVLILDAMGVIYQSQDDVTELLIPFIREHRGIEDAAAIEKLYTRASLGQLSTAAFWEAVGVPARHEDDYLAMHRLSAGLSEFLCALPKSVRALWCLSNDVSEWSLKLRRRLEIERYFEGFVISGDVACRKPDPRIYRELLARIGCPPRQCVLVDDRQKNLDAARALGLRTVLSSAAR
jgi:putative hydrolase of the HAD superfamily